MPTPTSTFRACPRCGHNDIYGLRLCPRCKADLAPEAATRVPSWGGLFQVVLFVTVLVFALGPYLLRYFPSLEVWLQPSVPLARQGDDAFRKKQYPQALALYKKAQAIEEKRTPNKENRRLGQILIRIAEIHARQKDNKQAIFFARRSIKAFPRTYLPYALLLDLLVQQRDIQGIAEIQTQLAHINSKDYRINLVMGNVWLRVGQWQKAKVMYQEGLAKRPENPSLQSALARLLAMTPDPKLRNLARAETLAKAAVSTSKGVNSFYLQTLAEVLFRQGKSDKAISSAKKALAVARLPEEKNLAAALLQRLQNPFPSLPKPLELPDFRRPSSLPSAPSTALPPSSRPANPGLSPSPTPLAASRPSPTSRPLPPPPLLLLPPSPPPPLPIQSPHRRSRRLITVP